MDKNLSQLVQTIEKMQNEINTLWVIVLIAFSFSSYVFFTCKDD